MQRYVLPVIHFLDAPTALQQADLAFECGADGVFLISHDGRNSDLYEPAMALRGRHPERLIGLNLLGVDPVKALATVREMALHMIWDDSPGVTSGRVTQAARDVAGVLMSAQDAPLYFGSVAFKYQPHEPFPERAAVGAAGLRMIPTTSGEGTGMAPTVEKIRNMHEALSAVGAPQMAVASGMTPDNVRHYLPHVSHFIVATGVSVDEHRFDGDKLARFVSTVRSGA